MVKALGTIFIVLSCILIIPVGIGIIGGVFGIVIGAIVAVFSAIGGLLGAIFGAIGWIFDGLFGGHWLGFHFFHCNFFTLAALVLIVALIVRARQNQNMNKRN